MIKKYGLKMTGLRKAAGETKSLQGYYDPRYIQISYDLETGEVLTDEHVSIGHQWWTTYHDPAIIRLGNATDPMTMQELADWISDAVAWRRQEEAWNARVEQECEAA